MITLANCPKVCYNIYRASSGNKSKEVLTMDIKAKIEELVEKVKNDKNFAADFKADPVKAVEKVIGVDLPDDQINKVIDGVKAKISVDDVKDKVGGLLGKLGL